MRVLQLGNKSFLIHDLFKFNNTLELLYVGSYV